MLTGNGTERDKGGLCCVGICKRSRCFYNITAKYLSTAFVKRQALAAAASKIPGGPIPSNGCSFPVCAKKTQGSEACAQAIGPAVVCATATGERNSRIGALVLMEAEWWRKQNSSLL